jgi:hypothetical protein
MKPATYEDLGWLMGFEPTTTGITIRDSTAELQPPLNRSLPRREVPASASWRARQDSNLLPPA